MSINANRMSISRASWAAYAVVEVVLFLIANLTAKNGNHPGTVSNIFFAAFVAGLAIALLLGAWELVRSRRATR